MSHPATIRSDDPEAVAKLAARLAELRAKQADMRLANKQARKAGEPAPFVMALHLNSNNMRRLRERLSIVRNRKTLPGATGYARKAGAIFPIRSTEA